MRPEPDPADPAFAELMAGLAAGDQDAARAVYVRFVDDLVRLAAGRLKYRLGSRADPESVAHSVFESFFEGARAEKFELHNWGMVFGLLAHITFRKCVHRKRAEARQKRGAGAAPAPLEDWQAVSAGPGPEEEAIVADLLAAALAGFDSEERAILDAYLAGATVDAVAQQVRLTARTVYRVLEEFRERLRRLAADE